MNNIVRKVLKYLYLLFGIKRNRYLCFLVLISIIALTAFLVLGLIRRTFVFYSALDGNIIVEERMQRRSDSPETDMRRYTEEALLGPVSPDASFILPKETKLHSLIFREGVVYAGFSETTALLEGMTGEEGVFLGFLTLNEGLRRNFSSVKDVKFFIGGKEIFFNEFNEIFADFADNTIKPVNGELTN
jgi:hypothetical protein